MQAIIVEKAKTVGDWKYRRDKAFYKKMRPYGNTARNQN